VTGTPLTPASVVGRGTRYDFNVSDRWFAFGQLEIVAATNGHDRRFNSQKFDSKGNLTPYW
jgi:hypothetical protein